jgi:hypothetical protein
MQKTSEELGVKIRTISVLRSSLLIDGCKPYITCLVGCSTVGGVPVLHLLHEVRGGRRHEPKSEKEHFAYEYLLFRFPIQLRYESHE